MKCGFYKLCENLLCGSRLFGFGKVCCTWYIASVPTVPREQLPKKINRIRSGDRIRFVGYRGNLRKPAHADKPVLQQIRPLCNMGIVGGNPQPMIAIRENVHFTGNIVFAECGGVHIAVGYIHTGIV